MIDFSQFDSLISMTMYFNNEDTCKQSSKHVGVLVKHKTLFALIVVNIIV